jgi:hypothetical protein
MFSVRVEPNAVPGATGCKITTWVRLHNKQVTKTWDSSRTGQDCTRALNDILPIGGEQTTATGAYYARSRGCVDLYFNGSSQSGWQRCQESEKVGFNRNG